MGLSSAGAAAVMFEPSTQPTDVILRVYALRAHTKRFPPYILIAATSLLLL